MLQRSRGRKQRDTIVSRSIGEDAPFKIAVQCRQRRAQRHLCHVRLSREGRGMNCAIRLPNPAISRRFLDIEWQRQCHTVCRDRHQPRTLPLTKQAVRHGANITSVDTKEPLLGHVPCDDALMVELRRSRPVDFLRRLFAVSDALQRDRHRELRGYRRLRHRAP